MPKTNGRSLTRSFTFKGITVSQPVSTHLLTIHKIFWEACSILSLHKNKHRDHQHFPLPSLHQSVNKARCAFEPFQVISICELGHHQLKWLAHPEQVASMVVNVGNGENGEFQSRMCPTSYLLLSQQLYNIASGSSDTSIMVYNMNMQILIIMKWWSPQSPVAEMNFDFTQFLPSLPDITEVERNNFGFKTLINVQHQRLSMTSLCVCCVWTGWKNNSFDGLHDFISKF